MCSKVKISCFLFSKSVALMLCFTMVFAPVYSLRASSLSYLAPGSVFSAHPQKVKKISSDFTLPALSLKSRDPLSDGRRKFLKIGAASSLLAGAVLYGFYEVNRIFDEVSKITVTQQVLLLYEQLYQVFLVLGLIIFSLVVFLFWFWHKNALEKEKTKILSQDKKKYRGLFETIPVGVHVVDLQGIIKEVNETWLQLLGFEREEVIGKSIFNFVIPSQREIARKRFQSKLKGEQVLNDPNRRYQKKNGKEIYVSTDDTIIYDASGRPVEVRTVLQNISLQRKKDRELAEYRKDLEKKVKEALEKVLQMEKLALLGRVASGMAHELNNPLGLAHGYLLKAMKKVEGLSKDHLDKQEMLEDHRFIETQLKRASMIIDYWMRYLTGDKLELMPLYLDPIVREGIQNCENDLEKYGVQLITDIKSGVAIQGERESLLLLITNLIRNACHAMEGAQREGVIQVTLSLENGDALLEVHDNGQGIRQENLNKIFDPFFTTKKSGKGTGLGLSLVSSYVKGHYGEIRVESKEGEGSKFILIFPLTNEPVLSQTLLQRKPWTQEKNITSGIGTVLVVDDEEGMRTLMRHSLKKQQVHNFLEAKNSQEALALLRQHEVDLLITDMNMDEKDEGAKLVEQARKNGFKGSIVLCTGYGDKDHLEQLEQLKSGGGITHYLIKGASDFWEKIEKLPLELAGLSAKVFPQLSSKIIPVKGPVPAEQKEKGLFDADFFHNVNNAVASITSNLKFFIRYLDQENQESDSKYLKIKKEWIHLTDQFKEMLQGDVLDKKGFYKQLKGVKEKLKAIMWEVQKHPQFETFELKDLFPKGEEKISNLLQEIEQRVEAKLGWQKFRIIVVDDDFILRMALKSDLEQNFEGSEIQEASNGQELLDVLAQSKILPDLILLDLNMPKMSGQDFLKAIYLDRAPKDYEGYRTIPIILTSGMPDNVLASFISKYASVKAAVNRTDDRLANKIKEILATQHSVEPIETLRPDVLCAVSL